VFSFRYLDVWLVLASAPFVVVAGLPTLGYVLGAAAWILTRAGNVYALTRAQRVSDPKSRAGLQVAAMMGRLWLVALAVVLARFAGDKDDGITAAVLVLAAFTVYFVLSFFTRDSLVARPPAQGRPTPS
jgi:hypothetical protein